MNLLLGALWSLQWKAYPLTLCFEACSSLHIVGIGHCDRILQGVSIELSLDLRPEFLHDRGVEGTNLDGTSLCHKYES